MLLLGIFVVGQFGVLRLVYAAAPGSVVINEVAWAGSADNANDEWIELYNTSSQAVDLSNWYLDDDHGASTYTIQSGTIAPHGYFLIEDHESAIMTVTADAIIDVSLANTGDSLQLYDSAAQLIDNANSSGGAWFAGSSATKATMERVDALASGDVAANWQVSTGSGQQSSGGSAIIGTPKALNSVSQNNGGGQPVNPSVQQIQLQLSSAQPNVGDVLTATVQATSVQNLFAYGLDLVYDPAVLKFKTAQMGSFLNQAGTIQTSFQAGLENGVGGKLVVAEARTLANKVGVSGSGNLFTVQFDVIGSSASASTIQFGSSSFAADPAADILAQFVGGSFTVTPLQIAAVTNLQAVEGVARYSVALSWNAVPGATAYQVLRQDVHGQWVSLSQSSAVNFVDQDLIQGGGFIVPHQLYNYRVIALQNAVQSLPNDISAQDTRGLKGDNNRSDRVDGRDLEQLARHFGEIDTDAAFAPLVDTTYDGQINGSDLIDLGINFAKTYP